jgi:hypothetical protein
MNDLFELIKFIFLNKFSLWILSITISYSLLKRENDDEYNGVMSILIIIVITGVFLTYIKYSDKDK